MDVWWAAKEGVWLWLSVVSAVSPGALAPSLADDFAVGEPTVPIEQSTAAARTLFQNVRIFDGVRPKLLPPSNVLVTGNIIERISTDPISDAGADEHVIVGDGRGLMPRLIDVYWHAFMAGTPQPVLMTADPSYLHLVDARQAEATLMRGFTTIRDLGGPVFG